MARSRARPVALGDWIAVGIACRLAELGDDALLQRLGQDVFQALGLGVDLTPRPVEQRGRKSSIRRWGRNMSRATASPLSDCSDCSDCAGGFGSSCYNGGVPHDAMT
ncbi:MAG TPA: hypothetical protein VKF37_12610 [Chloroflexota bacterium]|nr:hypothetical protein [Chloroflexota bacterium]